MPHQGQVLDVHQRKPNSQRAQHVGRYTLAHIRCKSLSEGWDGRYGGDGGAEAHGPRHHGQAGDGGHGWWAMKERTGGKVYRRMFICLYAKKRRQYAI